MSVGFDFDLYKVTFERFVFNKSKIQLKFVF